MSKPMGFWTEQDVLWYLDRFRLPYFPIYGELKQDESGLFYLTGEPRTGCKLCLFGIQLPSGRDRIKRLSETEPQTTQYAVRSIDEKGLGYGEVISYLNTHCKCKIQL